ncbi:PREDICTED: putative SWI/SNF-related matrix-associated actin-dependent regulator of chromatin subfamily A member 3-like 3 isoform X2 [Ipomoea nil]|uniref:putative SWI/SNF-related matrix-associated actin-dependent regulator of chromatin subfamily A member 3-like 3 isoform X2 n=1 Tax=Ipomoea nil TaxID=35883 RepID=UPI000901636B|nr:PREDICTED: putative SWI/SNF-related matrix-associated actin-dependent regulator of chromatin subfamily A member 3-like 3 isoform X2 [Ipomoea nil]
METDMESEKEINLIRSVVGSRVSEPDIQKALSCCNNSAAAAINHILDNPLPPDVKKTVTSTGARISGPVKQEIGEESKGSDYPEKGDKNEPIWMNHYYKWLSEEEAEKMKQEGGELKISKVKTEPDVGDDSKAIVISEPDIKHSVKAEPISSVVNMAVVKEEKGEVLSVQPLSARPVSGEYVERFMSGRPGGKTEKKVDMTLSTVVIEDGDFPEEADWMLVGRNVVNGLSTTKGRTIENNEIVHFAFPKAGSSRYSKVASSIVRFSTKRFGEIGRLPMEWGNCLIPLVNSKKVKVLGRCVAAPANLHLMQEIMLYVSFYIHSSVFTNGDKSSWRIDSPSEIEATIYPLLTLFKLLKINPFQKAEFKPDDFDSRKRPLDLEGASVEAVAKRIKGCIEQNKTEEVLSESTLNKLVGAAEMYDLKEVEPPETLVCSLRPYQKQALYWMSELEKGTEAEQTAKVLHPCWAAYRICDERGPAIYVNIFSGEATAEFPSALETARGGILADAMGLGKTVMTIALILARPGKGIPDNQELEHSRNRRIKGGTLIVCPMALLGQWKNELEAHSKPESISVFVHYGGERSNDPRAIAEPDVVLTTYGLLTASYKADAESSIFHKVDWHRVVLDEAHTIKNWRTMSAKAAFTLSAHCRPILVLPPTDIQVIECEQSEAERDFYDALYQKSKVQFDEFVAQGKVLHNFANILELLLRLRQCCNHPFLVMSRGDVDKYANLDKLAQKFLEFNPDSDSQNAPTRAYIEEVVEEIRKDSENTECPICLESPDDPVFTPCAHTMCRECLLSSWRNPSSGMCPICRRVLNRNELITSPKATKFRIDVNKDWKESSKVTKLMDCLQRIRNSKSGEKSIVFSQWTLFLDLLEIPLKKSGIGFLRFDGKTQQKQREKVLNEFSETTEKMVLLMSLKAGGVGLNLTAASNVFLMDPWWNPAVEEQAIMRIHRIGQKRTVCVRRFIVKETVEERMQQVQARKQKMIAGALTDDEVRSARIEELKMLFR